MCLINFHFQAHPTYKLIVVANRDEEYNRPTKFAHFWEDASILGGRDLLQMGTWLGVTKTGKFAAITNYRDPKRAQGKKSRGNIVRDFLIENIHPKKFIEKLSKTRTLYGGYNVLLGDSNELYHYNNVFNETNVITPGTHSLSNCTLNTPWPKVVKGATYLKEVIKKSTKTIDIEQLFQINTDEEIAPDDKLPNTGVGIELERLLSPLFIKMPNYGTRATTVVLFDKNNQVTFVERTYHEGTFLYDHRYSFKIEEM